MQNQNSRKHGFTLAEILITLTVIGVVAALTIPTLLQNTNQAELKTALKRDFADLQQATLQIINDNGGSLVNAFGGAGDKDGENIKNAFKGKLSYLKECSGISSVGGSGAGSSAEGCWHNEMKYLNGSSQGVYPYGGLILSNGTLLVLWDEQNMLGSACTARGIKACASAMIDVNGFNKPNVVGKDIFRFWATEDGLIPRGAKGLDNPDSDCNLSNTMGTNAGWGCTAKYLYE